MWRDLLYSWRAMRRAPAFAAAAALTLALGVGGNAALFTVIRSVLLGPLRFPDAGRLTGIRVGKSGGFTMIRYREMEPAARSFRAIGAFGVPENVTISGGGKEPEQLRELRVSADFLDVLEVKPALGRGFLPREDQAGASAVALISSALWRRRFGGDRNVAGKSIDLDAAPCTIVGVLPPDFVFPFAGFDVWVPGPQRWSAVAPAVQDRTPGLTGFARLRPGVTIEQARAELSVFNRRYVRAHPDLLDAQGHVALEVLPLRDWEVENVSRMLWTLWGAVAMVLLIACANVASLLLARAASRARELAVRAALGAARSRLIRQLLAESLLLAAAGGGLGILLALASLRAMTGMIAYLPRAGEIRIDGWVLAFAVVVSIGSGLFFGLLPSLKASRPDLADTLRAGGERTGGTPRRGVFGMNAHGILVVAQVALSVVLLTGAALLLDSLARLRGLDPGFQPARLLTMQVALPPARYASNQQKAGFYAELAGRVEALPGVRSAAVAAGLPTTHEGYVFALEVIEKPVLQLSGRPLGQLEPVTPDYFETMGIAMRRGRAFTDRDNEAAPPVAIINESLARRFWPAYPKGENPIGRHILVRRHPATPGEIVGIVADVREVGLGMAAGPELYLPCAQAAPPAAFLAARTAGDPLRLGNAVRGQVTAIDSHLAVARIRTMEEILEESLGQRRLALVLLEVFAGAAFLLATIGIYGVISYTVAQRTHEVGIRRALGARESDIVRLVLRQGLGLAMAGIVLGTIAALAAMRLMRGLLYGVKEAAPAIFAAIALVYVAVALAASYLPARRATQVDPMEALR